MNEEAAFNAWLDANPHDSVARGAYADWLREQDDPRCDWYELASRTGRVPTNSGHKPSVWFRWYWLEIMAESPLFKFVEHCRLPWEFLQNDQIHLSTFISRQAAEDACANAFASLPAEGQAAVEAEIRGIGSGRGELRGCRRERIGAATTD
ncbi:TIGR02996 domain-containing protein [Fimbriiglobus ruber]|uniref:TIGR02996 domain-containing protein n=1 Tax=Fimbriiglobus ruber TaxID=1908690 RepID=UPI001379F303|nr:TIGR02996 domain-containing protein [Fimbriiglobus ruber]